VSQSSADAQSVRPNAATTHSKSLNTLYRFEFRAQGGEYFRVWIVNLALTLLTLGIYSAWAKVRAAHKETRTTARTQAAD